VPREFFLYVLAIRITLHGPAWTDRVPRSRKHKGIVKMHTLLGAILGSEHGLSSNFG
jgi:hypothetical protein